MTNEQLWDDIFTVLKQHQDLCSNQHERPQILRFKIETLYNINKILANAYQNCKDELDRAKKVLDISESNML